MSVNKKSFRMIARTSKSFRMLIENFTFAVTFFFRIRERIRITFAAKLSSKLLLTINSKRIRLNALSKLRQSPIQTISSRTIRQIISPKEIKKAATTILIEQPIIFFSRARQKLVTILKNGRLRLLISPTLAQFFTLGTYDPQTLGAMDTETLGELDYVAT